MVKQEKKKNKKKKLSSSVVRKEVDLLAPGCMLAGYHMCHNAGDFLRDMGYPWTYHKPKASGKGKKKK